MKRFFVLALFALIIVPTLVSAYEWEGWGEGQTKTWTDTQLDAGDFWNKGCGDSCKNSRGSFQNAEQAGRLHIKADAGFRQTRPEDPVEGDFRGNYRTGYEQFRKIPGGFQEQWGSQAGSGRVRIKSHD